MSKDKKMCHGRHGSYTMMIVAFLAILAVSLYTVVLNETTSENVLENEVSESIGRSDAMQAGIAAFVKSEDFTKINGPADKDTAIYKNLQTHLNQIRGMNDTRYFYTAKRNSEGKLIYLVDGLPLDAQDFRNPGDPIEEEMVPYIERALAGETVYSRDIIDTDWGHILTACYPMYDSAHKEILGVLCIEMDIENTYRFIADHKRTMLEVAAMAVIILLLLLAVVQLFIRHYNGVESRARQVILEKNVALEKALDEVTRHGQIMNALATVYSTIFIAHMKDHAYELLEGPELMAKTVGKTGIFDDVMEEVLQNFVAPKHREAMREFLDFHTLAARLEHKKTIVLEYEDPAGRWYMARFIVKRRDENGKVEAVLYVARDFTEEKKHELDLQARLRAIAVEAKRANLTKTNFLRRMSHDIRTPLNGIIGMLHIADKCQDDPEKLAECKEKIHHSADYLLDLVNNVLDISKLESGSLVLENKPFQMGQLLLKSVGIVETSARDHGIRFEGGREASVIHHRQLIGSPLHLNRVLMNIASNAIKYNRPGGSIKVYCKEISSDDKTAVYQFVCEDTGLGMSKEFQAHAFEPFTQEGKETVTSFSGSGLGLSIVKDIVELMGGTIALESEENVGTKFTITIPFLIDPNGKAPEEIESRVQNVDLAGKRALLVEDNELNMEIARTFLEEEGLVIFEATNGKEAVEIFNQSEMNQFDYIFMDVMMPVMDGLTATKEIRKLSRADAKTVPIIAMTANAFVEDQNACLDAGMNGHVGKPIDPKALKEAMVRNMRE